MLFPEFKYVGFKTNLQSPTKIVDGTEAISWEADSEAYVSVYRFDASIKDLPSLGNLGKIPFYADVIYFDFDSANLVEAWEDAKTLYKRLLNLGVQSQLAFSGGKGFHLTFNAGYLGLGIMDDPTSIQNFAKTLCDGLKTFDPSIYNKSRVIRVAGSLNAKGRMFKRYIEDSDTLEVIIEAAKQLPLFGAFPLLQELAVVEPCDGLVSLWNSANQHVHIIANEQEPKFMGTIFKNAGEGERNEAAYTVSRRMARRGIPFGDALTIMLDVWNPAHCNPPLSNNELAKVVENAYQKGVNTFVEEGSYAGHIEGIEQVFDKVSADYKTGFSGFKTGYEFLDNYSMGFEPGETIYIAGRSGNFKSAILTALLQKGSKLAKKPAIMFSMEMGPKTLLPRTIQLSERMSKRDVVAALRAGKRLHDFQKTKEDFEYLKFCYLSNLGTEQIVGLINHYRETYGDLCAIGFDYLGLFRACNNNTQRTAEMVSEIKGVIARMAGCPVFCLAQAKQVYEGNKGDVELDRTCVKDSDSALDLADYSLGVWGNWQHPPGAAEPEKYLFGRFLKSRGCDDEPYGMDPYFGLVMDKQHMRLDDIIHTPTIPQFNQRGGNNE